MEWILKQFDKIGLHIHLFCNPSIVPCDESDAIKINSCRCGARIMRKLS